MNIVIPNNWLKEYLQTTVSPEKIAECLSLCSCSIEKITKEGSDQIYHIEITTNRVDMMSVFGIPGKRPPFSLNSASKQSLSKTLIKQLEAGSLPR